MQKYVFYARKGSDFDIDKIQPVGELNPHFPKPDGGLWASPVDSRFSWKNWSTIERFMTCDDSRALFFTLRPDAKVFYCETDEDIVEMERHGYFVRNEERFTYFTDARKMQRDGYDALYVDRDVAPYGWDVDTLFVINKDVIVPEEKKEVLRVDDAFQNVCLFDRTIGGKSCGEWFVDYRTADKIMATIESRREDDFSTYSIIIDKDKNLKVYENDWGWLDEIDITEIQSERTLKDVKEMKMTLEMLKEKEKRSLLGQITNSDNRTERVGSFSELFARVDEMRANDVVDDGKIHGGNKEDFLPG